YSHAEGRGTYAAAPYGHTGGYLSWSRLRGQWARAAGGHDATIGTAQTTITQLFVRTTSTSSTILTLDGGSLTSSNAFVIADGQTLSCLINIVGRKESGGANDNASFLRQVLIYRLGSTVQIVGSVQLTGEVNPSSWSVAITADSTNKAL